jgi:hypothetical protein
MARSSQPWCRCCSARAASPERMRALPLSVRRVRCRARSRHRPQRNGLAQRRLTQACQAPADYLCAAAHLPWQGHRTSPTCGPTRRCHRHRTPAAPSSSTRAAPRLYDRGNYRAVAFAGAPRPSRWPQNVADSVLASLMTIRVCSLMECSPTTRISQASGRMITVTTPFKVASTIHGVELLAILSSGSHFVHFLRNYLPKPGRSTRRATWS